MKAPIERRKRRAMPLVLVPTPLGNLRDITLRALDVLRDCDLLVAEDSRVARKLLSALGLPGKEIWTYHEHSGAAACENIVRKAANTLVAVVTDAGMPGISDPGGDLVAAARAAGASVEVLPGPSALAGAAVLSGFPLRRFLFEGFAPRTAAGRKSAFRRAFALGIPSVWYEAPQRLRAMLTDMQAVDPEARVFVLREYTKHFEQQVLGTPAQVAQQLPDPVRGEIAVVVMPSEQVAAPVSEADLDTQIDDLLANAHSVASIAKTLSERGMGERQTIYARASQRKRRREAGAATR